MPLSGRYVPPHRWMGCEGEAGGGIEDHEAMAHALERSLSAVKFIAPGEQLPQARACAGRNRADGRDPMLLVPCGHRLVDLEARVRGGVRQARDPSYSPADRRHSGDARLGQERP